MSIESIRVENADEGGEVRIVLNGAFSIENASALHASILDAAGIGNRVVIDINDVDSIDLTTLQLICSACKGLSNGDSATCFKGVLSSQIREFALQNGLIAGTSCNHDKNSSCIFTREVE